MSKKLFEPYKLGSIELKNRVVMAPMTRCRAINNVPNELIAEYYNQRSNAGLIITEGTSPSPNGLGYARMPGIFSKEQIEGWKKTTAAVHAKGGKIFVQLMHSGRIGASENLPEGAKLIGPSAITAATSKIWSDKSMAMLDCPVPQEMTLEDIQKAIQEFVQAAKNSIEAGFDGVELHGANGYLIEQFINPVSNVRTDNYGGSVENRSRFAIEVTKAVAEAIGADKTGIRFSPYGVASDMAIYDSLDETYTYLAKELNKIGIVYIHIADHSSMGAPKVPDSVKNAIRSEFKNTIMGVNGYNAETAEADLQANKVDLAVFGRPYIGNPNLVEKLQNNSELTPPDFSTVYNADAVGYTDYK